MDFTPTPDQDRALAMVRDFLKSPAGSIMVLTGLAGTGKTTLLAQVAAMAGRLHVVTPTGKAALRVNEATGLEAQTIHRFRYRAEMDRATGEVRFVPRSRDELRSLSGHLLVVEEASMVGPQLWQELAPAAEAGMRVLLVGDPFQLPPVDPDRTGWCALHLETPFRAHLEGVVRQAAESPVLRAAMAVRAATTRGEVQAALRTLPRLASPEAWVADRGFAWGGTVPALCHTNRRRHLVNDAVRRSLGYVTQDAERELQPGEPLLILKNNYQIDRYNGEVVPFGEWVGDRVEEEAVRDGKTGVAAHLHYRAARVGADEVVLCLEELGGRVPAGIGDWWIQLGGRAARHHLLAWNRYEERPPAVVAACVGYSLTAHKAQGSDWPEVFVVLEDTVRLEEEEGRRWTYTALTRAEETVTWTYG